MNIELKGNGQVKEIKLDEITYNELQTIIKNNNCIRDMRKGIEEYLKNNYQQYMNYAYQVVMAILYNYKYLVVE